MEDEYKAVLEKKILEESFPYYLKYNFYIFFIRSPAFLTLF